MNARLRALIEERARVWSQMQEIREQANSNENGELTAEQRTAWDKAEQRMTDLTADVDREQRADTLERDLSVTTSRLAGAVVVHRADEDPSEVVEDTTRRSREFGETFTAFLRRGASSLAAEQRDLLSQHMVAADGEFRALAAGTNTAGGYTVPPGFRNVLIETMKWYGAVRSVATNVNSDSGQPLQWPTFNGTAQVGRILAENTALTQTDPVFGTTTLGAYMYSSDLVLVSYQLLQDSAFNVEEFLARNLGMRIGRIQNTHFTTGTGTSQPLGIQTNAVSGVTLPTGNTTTLTYAGLVALIYSVDPAYRYGGSAQFMLSDSALQAVRLLVDTQQRPLWQPSVQSGQPDNLLGYPIVVNNDLPAPAASVKSALFGDFQRGYVVRDVLDVQVKRLEERYADYLQVGFFAYARADATVQDSAAYKALTQSAT